MAGTPLIRTSGSSFLGPDGQPLLLRGVCLGGWLNMENFITGYSANESLMRAEVAKVLGQDRADAFFERLLTRFFDEPDAAFLAESGLQPRPDRRRLQAPRGRRAAVRDQAGRVPPPGPGDRRCSRSTASTRSSTCTRCPAPRTSTGTPTTRPTSRAFWQHRHFQDRVVNLWEAIAEHYRDNPWVAGYNLLNEPADETARGRRSLLPPPRRGDPRGRPGPRRCSSTATPTRPSSACSTEPFENAVYTLHDYVPAGLGRQPALQRARRPRPSSSSAPSTPARTGTPILVGEFGPIYTGDEEQRRLAPRHPARPARPVQPPARRSWTLWMYKDIGRQGLVSVRPDTPVPAAVRRVRGQEAASRRRPVGQRRDRARRGHAAGAGPGGARVPVTSTRTRGAASTGCARCC